MIRIFNQYVSPKSVLLMFIEGALIALALLMRRVSAFLEQP
jgi:hypothetical protein